MMRRLGLRKLAYQWPIEPSFTQCTINATAPRWFWTLSTYIGVMMALVMTLFMRRAGAQRAQVDGSGDISTQRLALFTSTTSVPGIPAVQSDWLLKRSHLYKIDKA
jgi:hypothetical protein